MTENDAARFGPVEVPSPPSTRVEDLVEDLHGTPVADPYRWLENGEDEEVQRWVEEQNAYTRKLIDQIPSREKLASRIRELISLTVESPPRARKGRYFFTRRLADQNQPEVRIRMGLDGEDRLLLDVNTLSEDGTVALDWTYPSVDGTLFAYGVSSSGSEESTLYILDVDKGLTLDDVIPQTRHCSLAWLPDGSGFYYTRHPAKGEVAEGDETYYSRVFFHKIGTDWHDDPLVFGEDRPKTDIPSVSLSPDGGTLTVTVYKGSADNTDVYMRRPADSGSFVPIIENEPCISHARPLGEWLYLTTNLDAPNFRVLRIPVDDPSRENWAEALSEREWKLEGASYIGGCLFALYLKDVSSRVVIIDEQGGEKELTLPGIGSVAGLTGEWDGKEAFLGFTSFHIPLSVYRYDLEAGDLTEYSRTDAPVDMEDFEIRQEWATSPDGTRVPMFVGHRKGLVLDGSHPGLLSGYGGFNISLSPYYSLVNVLWMEGGGVFAVANMRGGGEFGETWHKAGMLEKKQNVFDDYHAAARHLIQEGYTSSERLALVGGSNGGLLVSAALVQKPALARAVVCSVPVIDMLRYHRFLLARYWMGEYGDPDNPDHFPFLYKYSPYHNVKDGTAYPSVFFRTAESDSRVDPMHAMKMAARVQAASSSGRPVLLWLNRKSGHGMGMPKDMMVRETADEMAYLFWQLEMEV